MEDGIHCTSKKSIEAIVHTFLAVLKAWKLKVDIIHIHAVGPGLMVPFAKLLGLKVVITNHGPDYDRQKWGKAAKVMLRTGEYLCRYLILRDWNVTVCCQEEGMCQIYQSEWNGESPPYTSKKTWPLGTVIFDLKSFVLSLRHDGVFLTLGYNTAIFNLLHRLKGKRNVINMDGLEWKRQKWGGVTKSWFWLKERFGCWFGNHLVADNPCIADHLTTRVSRDKITMIPYGGREINEADEAVLVEYGIEKNNYAIIIARAEPENSILEIVTAYSTQQRGAGLVVLGGLQACDQCLPPSNYGCRQRRSGFSRRYL